MHYSTSRQISIFGITSLLLAGSTAWADVPRYQDKTAPVEARVDDLLPRLTLDEKLDFLGGDRRFYIRPVPRLGLPEIKMADGPLGVRNYGLSTAYPATIGLAATWNVGLGREFGAAMGRDSRARGVHILLAPAVNIYRVPQNGRNFEYLSEDPFLASGFAAAITAGIQSEGVVATVKHFAANNQETNRDNIDVVVDERTLREIYLPPFKAAVQAGHAWAIMDAYNRLNGSYCTASSWLNSQILKQEWWFPGVVISDWTATHDTLGAANGGLDLEMPSGEYLNAALLRPLMDAGKFTLATLDDKVRRILRLEIAMGFLDRPQADDSIPKDDPRSGEVALQIARESLVLLKNQQNLLPLDRTRLKSIVVLGPNADTMPAGGGSSRVEPAHFTSVLTGLRQLAGQDVRIDHIPGPGVELFKQLLPTTTFFGLLKTEFFAARRSPALLATLEENSINHDWNGQAPAPGVSGETFFARWTGTIKAPSTGRYVFMLQNDTGVNVRLDNKLLLQSPWGNKTMDLVSAELWLEAGSTHQLRIEYEHRSAASAIRFAWGSAPPVLSDAGAARIRAADVVVLCAGLDASLEHEGTDHNYELPLQQRNLIDVVARLNPRTIVVLNSGGSVATSDWLENVPGLLQAWYPGQEGGRAVAEILLGDVNPSGKLPFSYEKRWEDCAAYANYPGEKGRVEYAEGIFVGYRWFDAKDIAPLFPFGFGLSYTSFKYGNLQIALAHNGGCTVTFNVTNTGSRMGDEIAQIYVGAPASRVPRAVRELKGFSRVTLKPGETKTVTATLDRDAFAYFDVGAHAWAVEPGSYTIAIGASSRDLRLTAAHLVR